jgi:hypothetical protein
VGNNCSPPKIRPAVTAKRTAAVAPTRRIQVANVPGMLVSKRDAAHNATPPAKDGTLPARPAAVPESSRLSPTTNTRKPAASQSSPCLRNFIVKRAVATTRPTPLIAQKAWRSSARSTTVPARPNTPPIARPMAAITSKILGVAVLTLPPRATLSGLAGQHALFDHPVRPGGKCSRTP